MGSRSKLLKQVHKVLTDRLFTEQQIERLVPKLHDKIFHEPRYLAEIIDTWNIVMNNTRSPDQQIIDEKTIPCLARPPKKSLVDKQNVDMNTILADVEPDLLLLDPVKLRSRHKNVQGLNLAKNQGEHWILLLNASRGFYLQDWQDLSKKIYYIEQNIIDFLYDKKDQKSMSTHPLIKSAASVEVDFDHMRTRYLFALRSGYKALSHMFSVQMALDRPSISDILMSNNERYLSQFAPFCSIEEYNSFANLIKNCEIDEDDAQIYEKLAELNSISY